MINNMSEARAINSSNKVNKTKTSIVSLARNTSCSHGWLHLVVQCIFGAIIITSFVLIVYMSMITSNASQEVLCKPQGCRITCYEVSFPSHHEDHLAVTLRELDSKCEYVFLVFQSPAFLNSTIPEKWLNNLRVRSNIYELVINGGNIKYLAPQAFMTTFAESIQRLSFRSVTIINWKPEMFLGLTSLKEISITNSYIQKVDENALQAVDDTLEVLSITHSEYWNPINLTGSSNLESLTHVYFSNNNFNNILNNTSFRNLQRCKVLYLNSCRINVIGEGTFDYLEYIEILHLNNNFLIVLPSALFNNIMSKADPRPRVNLQANLWYCDCTNTNIQELVLSNILLLEPVCYYPKEFRGKPFSYFVNRCSNDSLSKTSSPSSTDVVITRNECSTEIRMDGACSNVHASSVFIINPIKYLSCNENDALLSSRSLIKDARKNTGRNALLRVNLALSGSSLSMLELTYTNNSMDTSQKYGLLWYQESCPNEIYCISELPSLLIVHNIDSEPEYTFCPITLKAGELHSDQCIFYSLTSSSTSRKLTAMLIVLSYILTTILCIAIGACIVYAIIRKFPHLLKGSDRILIVKHKQVDALILPPEVPLRKTNEFGTKNVIFTLTDNSQNFFLRTKSIRSSKSTAPSYISALQPTEEQLTEWRLRHHFDNNMTIGYDVPYSLLTENGSMYCSLEQTTDRSTDKIYENIK